MLSNISIVEFKKLITSSNLNIIDIRNSRCYNNNHILNAINIPNELLILNPSKYLNKNSKYFIYCRKGMTSQNTCRILLKQGYKVVNIIGGYEEWILQN
ncbi:MAG: rhodanese-like domain-containing protein [Bacilli bacterium]